MFSWFTARIRRKRNARNFYGSIVALSRAPELYLKFGVPDTIEGRFEILVLHMFAALERLNLENGAQDKLNQNLVDLFFADMDTSSREMGVGDLKVPKKMRTLAAIFDERVELYKSAISNNDMQLMSDEFEHNIYNEIAAPQKKAKQLVRYMKSLRKQLAETSIDAFMSAQFDVSRDLWAKRSSK